MASPSTTWSPSSFQLRLAFNCRKPPPVFIRALRIGKKLDRRRVRVISVAGDGVERRPAGNSWINSSSSADAFSGWSGADGGGEQAVESQRKRWFGGIVGAGAAGLILVAGLTFAALSVSKRRITRPALEIEPLKTQHEVLLASDDQNDRVEQNGKEGQDVESDDSCLNKAGIDNDSSLSTENSTSRNNGSDMEHMLNSDDDINNAPIQEDFQNVSAVDDISDASHESPGTTVLPEPDIDLALNIENSDGILVAERSESDSEIKETPIDAKTTSLSVSDGNPTDLNFKNQEEVSGSMGGEISDFSSDSSFEPLPSNISGRSQFDVIVHEENVETLDFLSARADLDLGQAQVLTVGSKSSEEHNLNGDGSSGKTSVSAVAYSFANEQDVNTYNCSNESITYLESRNPGTSFSSAGIPAPSVVSAALQVLPGKVLVPAVVDQVQGQALAALQVLKVIEADVQPGDLCTRREYARWLVSASSTLSRNTVSKVYPAMYIENVTELAFDDITPEDPDFPSIQGLAEAGLISSKLSRHDMASSDEDQSSLCFSPESPLSRQDLVTWKMALEKKQLPKADRKILQQLSGFIDIDKINPDAWPALVADLSAGENGIIGLAFGYTRLFQPDKPVTKSQAAIALATGEASDIVSEELARIEAESMAENAVAAHTALVAQVEKDVNASFEKELSLEREKIDAVEKLAEEARQEVERLRAEREKENITLMKERAAVESEMEVLLRLRCEVEGQLESLMSNKVEISYEKERLAKLLKEAETENQEITRLQHELEVERKALSMARAWAEDEAKRAREQAKVLEEARDRWERHGIKVVVEDDLREEANVEVTWLNAGSQFSVEETVSRAETLVDKLKAMAINVRGKARDTISQIIQKIVLLTSVLKERVYRVIHHGGELKDVALTRMDSSLQELQQSSARFSSALKEGAKRVAGDCKEGVEKLTQKFKT